MPEIVAAATCTICKRQFTYTKPCRNGPPRWYCQEHRRMMDTVLQRQRDWRRWNRRGKPFPTLETVYGRQQHSEG